jgi:hypothetical protein
VDDILIFCEGNLRYLQSLKEILNLFYSTIGMIINEEKSCLYVWGLETPDRIAISHLINTQIYKREEGMKNLGFNLKVHRYYNKV